MNPLLQPIRFIRDEYVQAYRGLPKRAWILFAVNLVNASGGDGLLLPVALPDARDSGLRPHGRGKCSASTA